MVHAFLISHTACSTVHVIITLCVHKITMIVDI